MLKLVKPAKPQKHSALSPAGLLQPLPILNQVWEHVLMDFFEGLTKAKGKNTVLIVVDCLTKYTHFIALSCPSTAAVVADAFVKEIVRLHGFPSSIIFDRDKIFMSHFWRELFR